MYHQIKNILIFQMMVLVCTPAISQSHNTGDKEEIPQHSNFYKHRIALFSGFALIQGAVDENGDATPRPIPVIGLDYEYFFNPKVGLGWFNDLELASYTIPFEENSLLKRQYAFVTALVALYEPVLGITLFAGPGYELETHKNFPLLKFGSEFSKSFDGGWSAGVAISFDLKEVNSALSLGLTIVKGIGKPE